MQQRSVPAPLPEEPGEELNLRELWATMMRNRWLIAIIAAVVAALAVAYTSTQPRVYQSQATLRIDDNDPGKNILGNLAPLARVPGKVETEMIVLRSRRIAEAVADSLDLTLWVQEPQMPRSRMFSSMHVPSDAPNTLFELHRRKDGAYSVKMNRAPAGLRVPGTISPGVPFQVGSARLTLSPRFAGRGAPETIKFGIGAFRGTVAGLRRSLTVARPELNAQVVAVTYNSTDPEIAAAVPNAVVDNFIRYKTLGSKAESRSTVTFLREQVGTYEQELRRAENELRGFRERERVVSPKEEASEQVQRLAQLQAERDRMRSEREALGKLLAQVEAQPHSDESPTEYRQLASFPVFLGNRAVQDLLQSLTQVENERAAALVGRTEEHREVQSLDERKKELELQLYQIARSYKEGLDTQITSADAALGRFSGQLQAIPAREVEYARLLRQETLLADLYTLLQTRLKEAEILQAAEPSDVRVIDNAEVPVLPISPRPLRNLGLGLMLGVMLGVSAAFGRQVMDTRVRTREDVQAAAGGLPVIATIPTIELLGDSGGHGVWRFRSRGQGPVHVNRLVAQVNPASPASEAFRALRTNITFSGAGNPPKVLVVTSAMPGEGKSTSAANLAVTLAQQGTRTLLIDGDMRRGVLHHTLRVPQVPGLSHVLVGRATADEAIHHVPAWEDSEELPLYLMPTGVYPPNPAELLSAPSMARLLAEMRERFDTIVIDAPPLNLVTDAAILAKQADSTFLVTRVNLSDKRALHHASAQLHQVNATVAGVIMNGIETGSGYYGYHGYGYGYSSYAPMGGNGAGSNGSNGSNGSDGKRKKVGTNGR